MSLRLLGPTRWERETDRQRQRDREAKIPHGPCEILRFVPLYEQFEFEVAERTRQRRNHGHKATSIICAVSSFQCAGLHVIHVRPHIHTQVHIFRRDTNNSKDANKQTSKQTNKQTNNILSH